MGETIAAIDANNDTYCLQKPNRKLPAGVPFQEETATHINLCKYSSLYHKQDLLFLWLNYFRFMMIRLAFVPRRLTHGSTRNPHLR